MSELTSGQHTFNIDADLALTSESKPLTVPNGVAITLAGTGSITGLNLPAIQVEAGGTLNLAGPSFTKVQFDVAGDLNFTAGSIHDSNPDGPVIFINGGNFTMSGTADFSNNTAPEWDSIAAVTPEGVNVKQFAPITVYNGAATIAGGTITQNSGSQLGGALALIGSEDSHAALNIKGGEIANNVEFEDADVTIGQNALGAVLVTVYEDEDIGPRTASIYYALVSHGYSGLEVYNWREDLVENL